MKMTTIPRGGWEVTEGSAAEGREEATIRGERDLNGEGVAGTEISLSMYF